MEVEWREGLVVVKITQENNNKQLLQGAIIEKQQILHIYIYIIYIYTTYRFFREFKEPRNVSNFLHFHYTLILTSIINYNKVNL